VTVTIFYKPPQFQAMPHKKVTKFLCLNTVTQEQRPVEKRFYALLTSQLNITDGYIAKKTALRTQQTEDRTTSFLKNK
jgi:hypothetical protein